MKKVLALTAIAVSSLSLCQGQTMFASNSAPKPEITAGVPVITIAEEGVDNTNTVLASNPKLKLRFTSLFPGASSANWVAVDKGYYVTYINNGRKSSASFNTKGALNYAITDCKMEQLPAVLRETVKKDYAGYTLINAVEIFAHDEVTYQAVLENATGFVTLNCSNENVEKVKQVTKTN